MKKTVMFLLLFSFILTSRLWAQEGVWEAAKSNVYGTKLGGMLGRGLLNVATCFVDVIVHTVDGTQEGPPVVGTLTGLGSGIACTALRVTSGALDIVTSWVPGFNGFPVSRNYHNCLEAEEKQMAVPAAAPLPAPSVQKEKRAEQYAKPSAPRKHNAMEYVKK